MRAILIPMDQAFVVALIKGDQTLFLPLDLDHPWQTGARVPAIVRRLQTGANGGGGFCEREDGQTYYIRRARDLHEGQHIVVEIIGEPQNNKVPLAEIVDTPPRPAALQTCLEKIGHTDAIEVSDLEVLGQVRAAFPNDTFIFNAQDVSDLRHQAEDIAENIIKQPSENVTLTFEIAQTACLIDIDGSGAIADINAKAARAIADGIVGRNWGGIILIDFLPPQSKQDRRVLTEMVEGRLRLWPHKLKVHTMNDSGHLIIERQRLGPMYPLTRETSL